jgi:hypothetical protein
VVFTRRATMPSPALSTGWCTAVERFARAVHRYIDRIEMIPDRRLRSDLRELGATLTQALSDVRRIPRGRRPAGDGAGAVRAMLRAGTLCAYATEAALLAADASRRQQPDGVARQVGVVRELTASVRQLADSCLPQRG